MKFIATAAAALGLASTATAIASQPFFLVVDSTNSSLNGRALEAGHEGAAIEGLLLGSKLRSAKMPKNVDYYTYRYNYTKGEPNFGFLTWTLQGSDVFESEPMSLYLDPSTNVAVALFEPTNDYQNVAFDSNNNMVLQTFYDDLTNPPTDLDTSRNLYNWNMCEYNYEGYIYNQLCWSYGVAPPQNPTCQAVNVTRIYA